MVQHVWSEINFITIVMLWYCCRRTSNMLPFTLLLLLHSTVCWWYSWWLNEMLPHQVFTEIKYFPATNKRAQLCHLPIHESKRVYRIILLLWEHLEVFSLHELQLVIDRGDTPRLWHLLSSLLHYAFLGKVRREYLLGFWEYGCCNINRS